MISIILFVQADLVDAPAIALYESLGTKETALHFDIEVHRTSLASIEKVACEFGGPPLSNQRLPGRSQARKSHLKAELRTRQFGDPPLGRIGLRDDHFCACGKYRVSGGCCPFLSGIRWPSQLSR